MDNLRDVIKKYLEWAPMSLSIREVTRISALKRLDKYDQIFKSERILDVGCGDGKWWTHIIPNELYKVHGLDISQKEIDLASKVISAQCLDITSSDFLEKINIKKFNLIIGNCSLEHVYRIDKALKNIYDILDEDGVFILMVPTPYWALKGNSIRLLHRLSPRLSMSFSGFLNGFFQHWHLYNHNIWKSVLTNVHFKVSKVYGLGNSNSEFLFRLGLPTAFISFLIKCLTGKYLNFFLSFVTPNLLKEKTAEYICKSINHQLQDPNENDIFEYMIVCKK
jgi:SAM-dependent methyltransferase